MKLRKKFHYKFISKKHEKKYCLQKQSGRGKDWLDNK